MYIYISEFVYVIAMYINFYILHNVQRKTIPF